MADTKIINMEGGALGVSPVGTEKFWVQNAAGTVDYHWNPADAKTYMSNSPTLVTPALGTPASGTLTNCTLERSWAQMVSDGLGDSINNSTDTLVDWNGTDTSGGGKDFFTGATANYFIIPTGVTKVRVEFGLHFASNATGFRQAKLYDGTSDIDQGRIVVAAVNGAATSLMYSAVLVVAATNEIGVRVTQNSGGALNMFGVADVVHFFRITDLTSDLA